MFKQKISLIYMGGCHCGIHNVWHVEACCSWEGSDPLSRSDNVSPPPPAVYKWCRNVSKLQLRPQQDESFGVHTCDSRRVFTTRRKHWHVFYHWTLGGAEPPDWHGLMHLKPISSSETNLNMLTCGYAQRQRKGDATQLNTTTKQLDPGEGKQQFI